jgi:hypothetical protein
MSQRRQRQLKVAMRTLLYFSAVSKGVEKLPPYHLPRGLNIPSRHGGLSFLRVVPERYLGTEVDLSICVVSPKNLPPFSNFLWQKASFTAEYLYHRFNLRSTEVSTIFGLKTLEYDFVHLGTCRKGC